VEELSRILLQMNPPNPHPPGHPIAVDLDKPAGAEGELILGYLIILGQIGVEIILAGKDGVGRDRATDSERSANGELHRLLIQDRQGPWQAETNRTGLRIGGLPEPRAAAAENLRCSEKLGMYLEPDHRFICRFTVHSSPSTAWKTGDMSMETGDPVSRLWSPVSD
jgi:hypothetical protein